MLSAKLVTTTLRRNFMLGGVRSPRLDRQFPLQDRELLDLFPPVELGVEFVDVGGDQRLGLLVPRDLRERLPSRSFLTAHSPIASASSPMSATQYGLPSPCTTISAAYGQMPLNVAATADGATYLPATS